jgi:hypothetical protein
VQLLVVLGQSLEQLGRALEHLQLFGAEAFKAASEIRRSARAPVLERRRSFTRDLDARDSAIGRVGLARNQAGVDERAQDAGGRRTLDPLNRRKLARRESSVALDAGERRVLRRHQAFA